MKNTIRLNHESRLIVMDRTFSKLAENVRNPEYSMLQSVRRDYPDYIVVTRKIRRNAAKECYKGLTYDYMRDYISKRSSSNDRVNLERLEEMIEISKCHSSAYRYPVIKKWFLTQYPEVSSYGIADESSAADQCITVAA